MEEAGRLIQIDKFAYLLQKTVFANVKVEIDSFLPLKPGVLIRVMNMMF